MKVLHVYRTYLPDPPGGIQEVIRNLCLATPSYSIENRVFTLSPTPNPTEVDVAGSKVVRARSLIAPASCDIGGWEALRLFREQVAWADLIHFHFPWPFLDLLRFAVPRHKPCLMTYHSDIVRQRWLGALYAPLMRYTLRKMHRVAVSSMNYARSSKILQSYVPQDKQQVIPFGLVERPAPAPEASQILDRLGVRSGEFFLALGVLRYYKGLHYLIEAAASVAAPIVIAGSGSEGDNLREQVKSLGIPNVFFAGQVSEDEKTVLLDACKAFVFPSHLRSEAYGMVLVEAAMMGKAMITCEIQTGTSFINQDQETGLVIPPANPQALAQAMNKLLNDEDLCRCYGQAARVRYEQEFTAQRMGQRYAALYREMNPD